MECGVKCRIEVASMKCDRTWNSTRHVGQRQLRNLQFCTTVSLLVFHPLFMMNMVTPNHPIISSSSINKITGNNPSTLWPAQAQPCLSLTIIGLRRKVKKNCPLSTIIDLQ